MTHSRRHRALSATLGISVAVALVAGGTLAGTRILSPHRAAAASDPVEPASAAPVAAPLTTAPVATTPATSTPAAVPSPTFVPEQVAPLGKLAEPDAVVTLTEPLTDSELAAVRSIPALDAVTVVSTGSVVVNGTRQGALAVDPSTFRRVTPGPTAASDALWASIAEGNLATELTHDALPGSLVGKQITVAGHGTRHLRLGALAAFGLPQESVVMSLSRGLQLGLHPKTGLVISAPTVSPTTLVDELTQATGGHVDLLGPDAAEATIAGGSNAKGLPATWDGLFQQAASACPGLSWTILAAIGQIESGDGANDGPSTKGALGPMQFLPGTFAEYATDGDHDGKADILDAYDAVPTAARMLCTDGAGTGPAGLKTAIFAYNHADWYVAEVLALAARYR